MDKRNDRSKELRYRYEERPAPDSWRSLAEEVFQTFPFGILVTHRTGLLVAWNDATQEMLGDIGDRGNLVCCDVLGCRSPDGPLEETCLSELAGEAMERLPEVRVDLPEGSPTSAVWVTAAPLDSTGSRIVMQVRPGQPQDRRRRTEPHWVSGTELRISTLGQTTVESREGSLGGNWLSQRSGQLLKYLVCERHRVVQPEEVAEAIWPGIGPQSLSNVRYTVHVLRERLEPERPKRAESSFVVVRHGGYALDLAHVQVDADRFEACVGAGLDSFERGEHATATGELEEALSLYRGHFLAQDPYAEWAFAERDRLRDLAGDGLRSLAELKLRDDDTDSAVQLMERFAHMEPLDVEAHRKLFTLWIRAGRRGQAARGYAALRSRMLREFGEDLGFKLSELCEDAAHPLRLR